MRILPLVLLAGCLGADERPATWTYVHATIVEPSCASGGCHDELASREDAYAELTGGDCAAAVAPPGDFVFPGEPERSRLVHLLRADDANLRMPPDTPLAPAEIALVERWILEGAACD